MSAAPRRGMVPARLLAVLSLVAALAVGMAGGVALDRTLLHRHRGRPPGARPAGGPSFDRPDGGPGRVRGGEHGGARGEMGRGADGGRRGWDRMARELDLTPAQSARIDSILAQQTTALDSIRAQSEPRMRAVVEATRHRIDSVLTPGQVARLREMWRGRGRGRDGRGRGK